MIRRRVLPVLVGIGAISGGAVGCGDADKPSSPSAHRDTTATVADTTTATNTATTAPTAPPTTTVIKQGDPMPIRMGGAVAPMPRPSSSVGPAAPHAVAQGAAAPGAVAPMEAAPAAVAAVQIVHNHPADQPCQPLTDAEVKKALGDLD